MKAGLLSKKWTNRLRSAQQWRKDDHPLFQGRAVGYFMGDHPIVMGSLRLHEMLFNWMRPRSVVRQLADAASQMEISDSVQGDAWSQEMGFTEADLA